MSSFFTVSKHGLSILTMIIEVMLFPRAVLSSGEGLMQNKFHDPHIRVLQSFSSVNTAVVLLYSQ